MADTRALACNDDRMSGSVRAFATRLDDPEEAIAELYRALDPPTLAGIVLFCSSRYDLTAVAAAIVPRGEGLTVVGCTSSGELTPDGLDEGTITALGFPASDFRLDAIRFDDLDHFDPREAHARVRALVAAAAAAAAWGDARQVALFLVDGLSHREELLTVTLQDALGEVPLIGGSSGDGLAFRETFVLHEGAFRRDSALVAVLTSCRPMRVFRTQHYAPGRIKMVITRANPVERIVYEINAEPAADEYARLIGVARCDLDPGVFASHPPMVRTGGEYYVRSIQSANADGSLTFYCAIDQGLVLTLGEEADALAGLDRLFAELATDVGAIDHILGFDCVLNALAAAQRQQLRAVSARMAANRVIGFNTYGEQFHALHVNQTFTGLVIGR